jgi:hypothetical protein
MSGKSPAQFHHPVICRTAQGLAVKDLAKVSRNATISVGSPAFDRANLRENTP